MASNARIFFAGIGTTFVIIAAGFGGGLMFAQSAFHDTPVQTRASSHQNDPVRVILPTTAEAAEAPRPSTAVPVQSVPTPEVNVPEKRVEKVDTRKAEADQRERKKRYAERQARKIAAVKAKQQMEIKLQEQTRSPQPGILAFGGDGSRPIGFFGN